MSALKVISRTSVEQFRDTKLPIKEIAGQFGVGTILEGGVQRGGERVRINVQLIDAATDALYSARIGSGRIGERLTVRARSVQGGLHHEYRLAPAFA